jgi:HK97 family phage prohead protease
MKKSLETKDFKFTLSAMDDEAGTFTGYASIWGAVDSYGDIVDKGAFRRTVKDNQQFPLLWSHDIGEPIGVVRPKEDSTGLKVEGHINLDVQRGRETRSLMKQGAVSGLSIGYQVVKSEPDEVEKSPVRRLKEIKLWEISPVVFGACPGALVADIKADECSELIDEEPEKSTSIEKPAEISKPEFNLHLLDGFRFKLI